MTLRQCAQIDDFGVYAAEGKARELRLAGLTHIKGVMISAR
jgi:hypothetical protein